MSFVFALTFHESFILANSGSPGEYSEEMYAYFLNLDLLYMSCQKHNHLNCVLIQVK